MKKRFIFFAIMVILTVLTIGCSTPVADVPVVTPEVNPEPVQTPQPTLEITPEPVSTPDPDNNWVELFATIHKEMTRDDFNELFGVEGAIIEGGTRKWTHDDGTEVFATFLPELASAFLNGAPSLFYNPDTKFDVDRINALGDISNYEGVEFIIKNNYTIGDIFYDDIVKMCGDVDGIADVWMNYANGFIRFMWSDGEHMFSVGFREHDMSLEYFGFFQVVDYSTIWIS